jgi:hypothetical protein
MAQVGPVVTAPLDSVAAAPSATSAPSALPSGLDPRPCARLRQGCIGEKVPKAVRVQKSPGPTP